MGQDWFQAVKLLVRLNLSRSSEGMVTLIVVFFGVVMLLWLYRDVSRPMLIEHHWCSSQAKKKGDGKKATFLAAGKPSGLRAGSCPGLSDLHQLQPFSDAPARLQGFWLSSVNLSYASPLA